MRIVLALLLLPASAFAQAIEPTTLIGTYDGRWIFGGYSDKAWLEIKELKDKRLHGRVYYNGGGATGNRWWDFTNGTLSGNQLVFTIPASTATGITFTLDVDPATLAMDGAISGGSFMSRFSFTKGKER